MSTHYNRHIDIQISGPDAERIAHLAHELEELIGERTSAWIEEGKLAGHEGVSTRTYHTEGPFEHWLDQRRAREKAGGKVGGGESGKS